VSSKQPMMRCDSCGRRVRPSQHGIRLSDLDSGQVLGTYHARPGCREGAAKYVRRGVALRVTVVHPHSCGPRQERCDLGGMLEAAPTA
jgi:hypothetical protein